MEFASYRAAGKALYPVEFSHISYFVLGATVVSGVKKFRPFAGLLSLVSGAAYVIAAIASPDSIYNDASSVYFMIVSISQHMVLLFGGIVLLNMDKYCIKDIWIPILGATVIVVFSILVHNRIIYKDFARWDDMIIIDIVTGNILKYILPVGDTKWRWLKGLAIAVILVIVIGVFVAYYLINNKLYEKRKNKGLLKDEDYELGLVAVAKYFINQRKAAKVASKE